MKKRLKINGIIIIAAFLFLFLFPAVFLRQPRILTSDIFLKAFGFSLVLLGQLLRVISRGYKSEHSKSGHHLIISGPYNFVRNPMYLGILLIGFGIILILFRLWLIVAFLLIFIFRYILLIFAEEKKLMAVFGEAYKDYLKRVPRILPKLKNIFSAKIEDYFPLRLSWLKKEAGSIIAVLMLLFIIEAMIDVRGSGWLLFFMNAAAMFLPAVFFFYLVFILKSKALNP